MGSGFTVYSSVGECTLHYELILVCGTFLRYTKTVNTSNNNNSVWRIESRNRKLCVTVVQEMAFWFLQRVYLNGCHPALGHFLVA